MVKQGHPKGGKAEAMYIENLKNIERINYIVGLIYVVGCFFLAEQPWWLGALVGVVLTCINFTAMRFLVGKWSSNNPKSKMAAQLVMIPKMGLILLAVFLATKFLPISVLALATGFGIFLVSIAIETTRAAIGPNQVEEE